MTRRPQQAKRKNHWARRFTTGRSRVATPVVRRRISRTAGLLSLPALGLVIAQIVVAAPPTASFTISDTVPNVGQPVSFTASVTDEPADTHTFEWTFGDGGTSSAQNPSHTYTSAGPQTVTLTVTDSEVPSNSVTVSQPLRVNALPNAAFHFTPTNPNPNQNITFSSDSTDAEGAVTHAWDLDNDGSFDDGSDPNEQWSFPTGGNKTVRLRVTDGDGATDEVSGTVSVFQNSPPVASFNFAGSNPVTANVPDIGETVTFTSTATDPNGNGTIARRDWDLDNDGDFDDGSGLTAQRSFPTAGNKTVGLQVTDTSGATNDTTRTFRVNTPPTAAINILNAQAEAGQKRTVPLAGQAFAFTSGAVPAIGGSAPAPGCQALAGTAAATGSLDPEGALDAVQWDLDNNGTYELSGASVPSPAAGYPAGQRTVGLRVTDSDDTQTTTTLTFRVNAAPATNFVYEPFTPVVGQLTTFSSISSDPDGVDTAGALTYSWDLDNDGTFCEQGETGLSVNRAFPTASMNPGHPVKLRVTDTGGITREMTRNVIVQNTIPAGAIAFSPKSPLPGQAVTFNASATSPTGKAIQKLEWDFDFGLSGQFGVNASGASVTRAFNSPGPKSVALRVTEAGGGFAIVTTTVHVNAPPRAGFNVAPSNPFAGDTTTISSTSMDPDGPLVAQRWDLDGDGQFDDASGPLVSARYLNPGRHEIRLRVTDSKGAVATASGAVNVQKRPVLLLPDVVIDINGSFTGRFTRVKVLRVQAPAGTKVLVICKGKGCPKTKRVSKRGKGRMLRFKAFERRFRAGTKLIVRITKPGFIGRQSTWTMRSGKGPKRVNRCLAPGANRATKCPVP
jgi:large repetitive protein